MEKCSLKRMDNQLILETPELTGEEEKAPCVAHHSTLGPMKDERTLQDPTRQEWPLETSAGQVSQAESILQHMLHTSSPRASP
jgi:hypothetical protein